MSDRPASPSGRENSPQPPRGPRGYHRSRSPRRNVDSRSEDSSRRREEYASRRDDSHRPSRNDDDRRDRDRDRDRPRPKKNFGGFKYKEKRRDDDDDRDDRPRGGSYRGYRNRSPSPRRRDRDRDRDRDHQSSSTSKSKNKSSETDTSKPPTRAPAAYSAPTEEMIIVHVNDRLGTKAQIPCFASDRIKEFKVLVAAKIGREPHEILLKRQGQRPFKDILTLADYEISNGVQLDLEVDTGD
ncbi:ubiquitin-related domain-containing protein [Xylariaceae sp. FL1019]|nr:ubiquitin-related domain-containing protein [Xylariaceae sp. FL1019]